MQGAVFEVARDRAAAGHGLGDAPGHWLERHGSGAGGPAALPVTGICRCWPPHLAFPPWRCLPRVGVAVPGLRWLQVTLASRGAATAGRRDGPGMRQGHAEPVTPAENTRPLVNHPIAAMRTFRMGYTVVARVLIRIRAGDRSRMRTPLRARRGPGRSHRRFPASSRSGEPGGRPRRRASPPPVPGRRHQAGRTPVGRAHRPGKVLALHGRSPGGPGRRAAQGWSRPGRSCRRRAPGQLLITARRAAAMYAAAAASYDR